MPSTIELPDTAAAAVTAHTFLVTWEPETLLWGVEHVDRDDVYTQGADLDEARHNAVEVLALVDEVDESDVGPVRFVVDGPVDVP